MRNEVLADKMPRTFLTLLLALLLTAPALAQEFVPGDPVPAVDIEHFLKGEKLESFDSSKIYLLEFWATWCGPCKAAMPHLKSLSEKYKGKVTVIALSDEKLETVEDFLGSTSSFGNDTWSQVMPFAVATDPDGSVKKDIFTAAGRKGIPSSFLIANNKLQWVGHPMELDQPLQLLVAGEWKPEMGQRIAGEKAEVDKILSSLNGLVREAMQSNDWNLVLEPLGKAATKYPNSADLLAAKWQIELLFAQDYDAAYATGEKFVKKMWDNAQSLNQVAWTVVDDQRVKTRNLEFAMRVATRANELTRSENGAILDTLARVYYEKKQLSKAIEWQKRAVEYADDEMLADLEATLEKYELESKTARF